MNEAVFQTQWTQSIRRHLIDDVWTKDFVYHEISDMSIDQKPADCFLFYNWQGWLMELKIHKKTTAFAFNKIEPHQIRALSRAKLSGNTWYIIINVNYWRKAWENYVCVFDIVNWMALELSAEKKSVKLDVMREKANYILIKKWGLWQVEEILKTKIT